MKQATQILSSEDIRQFAPLGKLSDEDARELLGSSITVELSAGTPVFTSQSRDKQTFYLVSGAVQLEGDNQQSEIIEAGSKRARTPLGRHLPGQHAATAIRDSVLISFDADMLDLFLNWTNPQAYVVSEIESDNTPGWVRNLLKAKGLQHLNETQIEGLIERMKEVHFRAGDVVVSQDADDDYYYVIKTGKAEVSRTPDKGAKPIKLAELSQGDSFGEEALLSQQPRNATVTMREDGDLMRLSRKDFAELLAHPMLKSLCWANAERKIEEGATLVDIRDESDYQSRHLPDAINIPFPILRLKLNQLSKAHPYIVYCEDGGRSSAAAFIMNQHGFETMILDGGLAAADVQSLLADLDMHQQTSEILAVQQDSALLAEPSAELPEAVAVTAAPRKSYKTMSKIDYWGAPVGREDRDIFEDSPTLDKARSEKPTPLKSSSNKHQKSERAELRSESKFISSSVHKPYNTAPKNYALRKHILTVLLIAAAGFWIWQNYTTTTPVIGTHKTTQILQESSPVSQPHKTTQATLPPAVERLPSAVPNTIKPTPQPPAESDQVVTQESTVLEKAPATDETNDPVMTAPIVDPATRGFRE